MNFNDVPKMMDEVFNVLAERFGSTAEHLWAIALRQAYVEATAMLIFFIALIPITIYAYKGALRLKAHATAQHSMDWDAGSTVAIIIGAAILLAAWGSVAFYIDDFLTAALNPEYFVLRQIFQLLGGGGS